MALMFLASLPDEYEHQTVNWLHGKNVVSFDEMCFALYTNEIRGKEHVYAEVEAYTKKDNGQTNKQVGQGNRGQLAKSGKVKCSFHFKKRAMKERLSKGAQERQKQSYAVCQCSQFP